MAQCNTRGIWNEGGFGTRPYRFPLLIFYNSIIKFFPSFLRSPSRAWTGSRNPGSFSSCLDSGSPLRCARNDGYCKVWCQKKLDHRV